MKLLIIALALIGALFAGALLSTDAHAAAVERVRVTTAADCSNGQRCIQLRTVTFYEHGQGTLVVHKRRTAPAESRTPTDVYPWGPWRVVGAVVIPAR